MYPSHGNSCILTDSTMSSDLLDNNEHLINHEGRQKHHNRKKFIDIYKKNPT